MFVPSRKRWAYLPRTPPLKLYSGRISSPESEGLLVFFIGLALTARGRSGVDNANLITPFCMRNYYQAPRPALTDKEPPLSSTIECSASAIVIERASPKAVAAS